jgi:pre-mRNA-splicing helicase BRR2
VRFFKKKSNLNLSDDTSRCDVATFVNSYPTLDVSHELVKRKYTAGSPIILKVTLARDVEDGNDNDQTVVAPFSPHKKLANWWLVVSDA